MVRATLCLSDDFLLVPCLSLSTWVSSPFSRLVLSLVVRCISLVLCFVDATSVLHYRIGGVSHAEVRATGNVALPGAAAGVLLGSLTAIQKSTNTLLINPTNSFVDGVLIGNSNVLIRGNQMAIGSTDFAVWGFSFCSFLLVCLVGGVE